MNRRRQGIGLLEIVLAMSIAITVIGVLAAVVSRVMLANAAAHEHLQTVVTLGRLGEQFRRDAHAAHRVAISDEKDQPARLTLDAGEQGSIEYEITAGGMQRVATTTGKADHRDLFVLPGLKFLGWTTSEGQRDVSLILGLLARPQSEDATLRGKFAITGALAKVEPTPNSP